MKRITQLIIVILILIQSNYIFATSKKNLCSITINSNEEVELFKQYLSPDQWNFIELAPDQNQPENKNWFQQACQKKINCDILVISGHFGGTFFGTSKSRLTMEDLEANSCENACPGIMQKPKEVFLFGCNTLASKKKDLRTPEEYMNVLLADGFSAAQASQIASFRYSQFGHTYEERMANAFSSVPKIYGFTSIGPSGKTIEPLLKQYFEKSQNTYNNFSALTNRPIKNEHLLFSLKNTSISQISGSDYNTNYPTEKPFCYVKNSRISRLDKLKYIKKMFLKGQATSMLSHIEEFLRTVKESTPNPEEAHILDEMKNNKKIKEDLLKLIHLKGDIYIPLKVQVLNTLKDLNIINLDYAADLSRKLIDVNTPFTELRRDMICSSGLKIDLPVLSIPQARWKENNFINTLMCLKIKSPEAQSMIAESINFNQSIDMKYAYVWYFLEAKSTNPQVHLNITKILKTENLENLRLSAAIVLYGLKPTDIKVQTLLAESILNENSSVVLFHLVNLFKKKDIIHPQVLKYLELNLNRSKNRQVILEILNK